MRLPLGIFTGVGFLWIATVIGLCFGGGQLGLGIVATGLGILTLWAMEWIDVRIPRMHHAILVVTTEPEAPTPGLDDLLRTLGYRARLRQQTRAVNFQNAEEVETHFDLTWKQAESADPSLGFLAAVNRVCGAKSFELVSGGDR